MTWRAVGVPTPVTSSHIFKSAEGLRGGMSECDNCGSFVTETYVRVFAPTDEESVRVCPHCEDMVRDGAEIRAARSRRS